MARAGLRPWGEKARALTRLGAIVWAISFGVAAVVRLVTDSLGGEVPELVRLVVGLPLGAGIALFLLAGCTWLAAEVGAGLREER